MMLALKIAFRNIFRHSRKNLLILLVTALISLFLFLLIAFADGAVSNIKNGIGAFHEPLSDFEIYDARIFDISGKDNNDSFMDYIITDSFNMQNKIEKINGVSSVYRSFGFFLGDIFFSGQRYKDLRFISIDSNNDDQIKKLKLKPEAEKILREPAEIPLASGTLVRKIPIFLHWQFSVQTDIKEGDDLTLFLSYFFDQVHTAEAYLAGFYTPIQDNAFFPFTVLLNVEDLGYIFGYDSDKSFLLKVNLKPRANKAQIKNRINELFKSYDKDVAIMTYEEMYGSGGYDYYYKMAKNLLFIIMLLIFFISSFGIMNASARNLMERKKEVGTYYCLGTRKGFLKLVYSLEVFMVNMSGCIIGIIAGIFIIFIINILKIHSTDPGFMIIAGGSYLTLGISPDTIVLILAGMALVTIITSLTSLGRALKVSPIVAVKESEQ